jgi:hypothetical protein
LISCKWLLLYQSCSLFITNDLLMIHFWITNPSSSAAIWCTKLRFATSRYHVSFPYNRCWSISILLFFVEKKIAPKLWNNGSKKKLYLWLIERLKLILHESHLLYIFSLLNLNYCRLLLVCVYHSKMETKFHSYSVCCYDSTLPMTLIKKYSSSSFPTQFIINKLALTLLATCKISVKATFIAGT